MNSNPFDTLTKALASGTSRRGILKAFAMTIAGGALVLLGSSSEAAPKNLCRKDGLTCNKHSECCSGNCVTKKNGHGSICAPA
jgi:hypothetical protein